MQIIAKTIQCAECGCIAMADATYCPKCGSSYRKAKGTKYAADIIRSCNYPVSTGVSYVKRLPQNIIYQFVCPCCDDGNIDPTKLLMSLKCPLRS